MTTLAALGRRPMIRALLVLLAGLAAQSGCLHAIFYLDDTWQIEDSDYVEGGLWWVDPSLWLTRLSYYLTWRIAGMSPFAFHLGNLVLHLATALAVYWLARYLLAAGARNDPAQWETVSWLGALIFVVHPLTSEVTHYARARDHGLVGFFCFVAAGFTALAMRRGWRWGIGVILAIGLAAISKGPGLPQAVLAAGIVAAAFVTNEQWRRLMSRRDLLAAIALAALAVAWLASGLLKNLGLLFESEIGTRAFGLHALTQCRIFPQYLWRMVLPIHLCSDHLVASTERFDDPVDWLFASLVILSVTAAGCLWYRRLQPWALVCSLALAPILIRWLYVTEPMVEYRLYPAMPFVGLLMAMALCHWRTRDPRFATAAICALLLSYGTLTRLRSEDWRSSAALHGQILAQYPLQLRAMNGLSYDDLRAGRQKLVYQRYPDFTRRLAEVMAFNRSNAHGRYYENWPLWAVYEESMVAEAIAADQRLFLARQHHNLTAWNMNQSRLDRPDLWARWRLTAGRIAYLDGNRQGALRQFVLAYPYLSSHIVVDREIRKILPAY